MADIRSFTTLGGGFPSVVITAIELTTSIGTDTESTWDGVVAGRSGIRPLTGEFVGVEIADLPVRIGGQLLEDPTAEVPERPDRRYAGDISKQHVSKRRMSYVEQAAHVMTKRLWDNAGRPDVDPTRLAAVVGTGLGGGESMVQAVDALRDGGVRTVSPFTVQMAMPNGACAVAALEIGARAGAIAPVSACSTGNEAIAHAWRQIVLGDADIAVCGGIEGRIDSPVIAPFSMMRALSTRNDDPARASRPFDTDRDGFVFGEAQALMIVETEEHALARGAKPIARLMGAGITSDSFHMVQTDVEGRGGERAMRRAVEVAGLTPSDIDLINAHATATPIGDVAEAKAIRAIGTDAAVYAPKGALGHSIGAVGALETALTALALRDEVIPPTLNLDNQDPDIDLDIVHGDARRGRIDYALNNSFGFGGHDVALVLGRY
ncbi:KasA/KasB family beta-ketoacyl-ACP synthase [Tsukamurella pseudospumae]|uniref:Beta-ketoacyl-[acyl-carrier-protein] synthase II n=1 Tax=Tsukamurella pseudospumae TaxID=239498 RepID=A0A138AWC0_9ACTN|nr:KasA/KasB family beta-ketoacyl-ACP synthase [Tsukamurella pseudospumae]KXO94041.1 beta-ketoacyl-[acyl-carrier-protein] synthase II [Tsukamurella pseudospumae]KXP14712.1 beta-ketoacyl-[acyl-carrier-protein] synthase II [Tsukamurella pseudospumae]